jgi:hypothetical protein
VSGHDEIMTERQRQIDEEGYSPERDAGRSRELASAAEAYRSYAHQQAHDNAVLALRPDGLPHKWPWGAEFWKPASVRRNLVKAGALYAAARDAAGPGEGGAFLVLRKQCERDIDAMGAER